MSRAADNKTDLPTIDVTATKPEQAKGNKKKSSTASVPKDAVKSPDTQPTPDGDVTGKGEGGVDGYRATRSSTATKTNTPLRDVPQSIAVIPKELAQDRGAVDLNKALTYVPGVVVGQGEGNRDAVVIRGVSTTADFFIDGVRDDVQYFRDLYNTDRIEVLKGANAMIFGRGGGGGVVNRVTKKADGERIYEGTVTAGAFDNKRASVDAGQAVSKDFAVRLNAMYENSGSYRDFFELERYGFNPTVTWKPSDATTVRFAYEYLDDHRTADRGIPSQSGKPAPVSANQFFGNPDQSYVDFTSNAVTGTIEHRFDNGIKLKNHTSFGTFDKFYQNVYAGGAADAKGVLAVGAYNNHTERDNVFNQTDLTGRIDMGGGIAHTLLVGTEIGVQNTDQTRLDGAVAGEKISLTDSIFKKTVTFSNTRKAINQTETTLAGVYVQDQLEITRYLDLIGGVRFDYVDIDYLNKFNGAAFGRTDNLVSPRAGVVFKPLDSLSLYASYSNSFLPSAGDQFSTLDATTETLAPQGFVNREIGFKWDVLPRLAFAGALFQLDRTNQYVAIGPGISAQVGRTRTEGAELSLTGNITPDWEVVAGYGYQVATIVTGDAAAKTTGHEVGLVPHHTFSLWNKYHFLPHWAAGIGVVTRSDMYAAATNAVVLPGMTRVDAGLFWDISETLKAQLNVENVFDVDYAFTADNDNNITPGSPRSFLVTVTNKF